MRRQVSASRLVTLTGPGGSGKTRLALQVAGELHRAKRDGKWMADLSSLEDPDLVPQTIVASLGIRSPTKQDPAAVLEEHLADRELLLVLDNCEHVIDSCAPLAEALLRAAPGLHILATSRRPLRVEGEHVFVVPPLSVPQPLEPMPGPEALGEYESVRLFAERATAVDAGFTVTVDNKDAVAEICRALNGIPLALELAAARLRILTPQEILHRLGNDDDRFPGAPRTAPARHRSMRATMDWSFGLCTPDEQLLWSRLSVFPGDFSLEGAEDICSGSGLSQESITTVLAGLVDQSIVTAECAGGRSRYRMLESVRAYGRDRLRDSGESEQYRRRHRDHFRRLADTASAEWFGPHQVEWMSSMRREQANLRAALGYSFEQPGQATTGLAMAASLEKHWMLDGNLTEGRSWLDRGLGLVEEPRWERARGLVTAGRLALNQGNPEITEALLTEALALGHALGTKDVVADSTHFLGAAAEVRGDDDKAAKLIADALREHRDLGNDEGTALGLARLAMIAENRADPDLADAYFGEAVATCADRGEVMVHGFVIWNRALAIWRRGDTEQACDLVRERLRISRTCEDPLSAAESLEALAWIAASDREYDRAATLLGSARALFWSIGAELFKNFAVYHEACVAVTQEELGTEHYETAFSRGAELPVGECVAYALGQAPPQEPPPPPPSLSPPTSVLTSREIEVARLVGLGLSNQQIATKLVVSRRTVESHVAHILAKLDLTSRAQVAAVIADSPLSA